MLHRKAVDRKIGLPSTEKSLPGVAGQADSGIQVALPSNCV